MLVTNESDKLKISMYHQHVTTLRNITTFYRLQFLNSSG